MLPYGGQKISVRTQENFYAHKNKILCARKYFFVRTEFFFSCGRKFISLRKEILRLPQGELTS